MVKASPTNEMTEVVKFDLFPNLPKEIREKIWEAAWPTPGIHFLRIFDPCRHRLSNKIIDGPSWDYNFSLGAPWNEQLGRVDWIEGNISMYHVDDTLKKTCKESRDVAFRLIHSRTSDDGDSWASFGVSVFTGDDEDDNDPYRFFIHKRQDVICLQFCDYYHAKEGPFWGIGFGLSMLEAQERIAIEYKPPWDEAFRDEPSDAFLLGVPMEPIQIVPELDGPKWVPFHFPSLRVFYVIDYTAKRNASRPVSPPSKPTSHETLKFYAVGKTFHVIQPGDESWEVISHVDLFVEWLREKSMLPLAIELDDMNGGDEPPKSREATDVQFQVLGCVED
jgi:hypothetical protein